MNFYKNHAYDTTKSLIALNKINNEHTKFPQLILNNNRFVEFLITFTLLDHTYLNLITN